MALQIVVTHSGGKKIDATVGGFTINTDQSKEAGGEGAAPEPFVLFLSALATCAGIYVVGFCEARGIPTEGIRLVQDHSFDEKTGKLLAVKLDVVVPPSFPEKYRAAVERVAGLCAVKKAIENPPSFEIAAVVDS
jgi:ribosomal protein S12 methylthiotransferase accessory factor